MARPKTVVEIGTSNSTLILALALQQAQLDWKRDRDFVNSSNWQERAALLNPLSIPGIYQPQLITINDSSAKGFSAEALWHIRQDPSIDKSFITFIQKELFTINDETIGAWSPIDLVWINAGTLSHSVFLVSTLWEYIAPGGYLCLHEPMMTTTTHVAGKQQLHRERSPLWEEILFRLDGSYEAITLPELHQHPQSGLGIVRKRLDNECIVRSGALQAELIELGEIPIRNDLLPIGLESARYHTKRKAVTNVLSSSMMRSIYAVIVLGAKKNQRYTRADQN